MRLLTLRTLRTVVAATGLAMAVLLPFSVAGAQHAFIVRPESRVILLGKTNVHSWSCATSTLVATAHMDTSASNIAGAPVIPTIGLSVVVPVKTMNCGKARMNRDMFRALKADSFPAIRYVLTSYVFHENRAVSDSFFIQSVGELTVAGVTRRVEIPVRGVRRVGAMAGEGGVRILMTDFGIKPPTAFLGAIRVKNTLDVRLEMLISTDAAQSLSLGSATPH